MENSPNKISSEPYDEPAESGAEAISANEGPQIREEEDDDDSSHQVAESESNVDRIEERSGREDRKDREDIEDLEIHTSNLEPAMEKSYLVLDSDEEYICPTEGGNAGDRRSNPRAETVGRDAELTRDAARQLPQESLSVVPSLPDQTSVSAKSAAVSSAARAAIEAARAEAEKMIAQSQSDDIRSNEKREKKKKQEEEGRRREEEEEKEEGKEEERSVMLQCSTGANLPSIVADPDFSPPECVFHSYCIYLIFAEIFWYHSTERLCWKVLS